MTTILAFKLKSPPTKKRFRLKWIAALLAILVGMLAFTPSKSTAKREEPHEAEVVKVVAPEAKPKLRILIARRDIQEGEQLTTKMLAARDLDESKAPADFVKISKAKTLLKKVANKPIHADSVIVEADFDEAPPIEPAAAQVEVKRREIVMEINPNKIDKKCLINFSSKRFDVYWNIKTSSQIVTLLLAHSARITTNETSKCYVPTTVIANTEALDPPPCVGLTLSVDEASAAILSITQKQNMLARYPSFSMSCHLPEDEARWENAETLSMNDVRKWIGDIPFFSK